MFAATELTNLFRRKAEELAQSVTLMVEELPAMDDDQCVHFLLSNQISCHNGLAECRRSRQDAYLMLQQDIDSLPLFWTQDSSKLDFDRISSESVVDESSFYLERLE